MLGVASRIDLFPFIPRDDTTLDRLSVNVTTLIAAAVGKIVVYISDALGRPASLLQETGDLGFSSLGLKEATSREPSAAAPPTGSATGIHRPPRFRPARRPPRQT